MQLNQDKQRECISTTCLAPLSFHIEIKTGMVVVYFAGELLMYPQETDDDNLQDVTYAESGSKVSKDSSTSNIQDPVANEDTLGSCGCVDYHMADCPIRTSVSDAYDTVDWYFE